MRRLLAYLMAALMLLSGFAALAEDELIVDIPMETEPTPEVSAAPEATAEPGAIPGIAGIDELEAEASEAVAASEIVLPEVTRTEDYEELEVGVTTQMSGCFFTDMWGNNTSDIDVRYMLHGYNLMEWQDGTGSYGIDPSVVSNLIATADAEGNRTYNIALYDDLYYSDGMPITARDYAFSILLSMAPQVAEIGGQTTGSDYLVGAAEYKSGESAALAGVRLVNDTQFTITVSHEYLPFFYELALLNYNPYPIHVIAPGCIVDDVGEGAFIRNMTEEELAAQQAEMEAAAERVAAAEQADAERKAADAAANAADAAAQAELDAAEEPEATEETEATEEPEAAEEPEASEEPVEGEESAEGGEPAETVAPEPTVAPALVLPEVEEGQPIFTAELLQATILDENLGYLSHPSVVSGPYVLTGYDAEAHTAEFARNLMYKGNSEGRTPSVERVVFKPVTAEGMMQDLADGNADLLNKVVNSDVLTTGMALVAQNGEKLRVSNYTRSGYSFISFSCEREATGSLPVRKAIAHCLDKEALVTDYVGNYGLAADGYYGLGQWMYQMVQGTLAIPQEEEATGEAGENGEAATGEAGAAAEPTPEPVVLTMENIPTYALDVPAAVALLEEDGWTLNLEGEAFDPEVDEVRCKKFGEGEDEHLVALDLKMIYPEGNGIGEALEENFVKHLAEAGVKLTVEAVPMTELLNIYYRNVERDVDLIFLATNFATVFDPSSTFNPADAYQGGANRTGIVDEELYRLAVDLRMTEPGDVLTYCQKWVAFQERFMEVLPTIPIYSNVYFDFATTILQDYEASASLTWSQALTPSYLSDAPDEEETEEGEETELAEGEVIIE